MEMSSKRMRQLEYLMRKVIEEECMRNPNARALVEMLKAEAGLRFVHLVGMEPISIKTPNELPFELPDPNPKFIIDEKEFQFFFNSEPPF